VAKDLAPSRIFLELLPHSFAGRIEWHLLGEPSARSTPATEAGARRLAATPRRPHGRGSHGLSRVRRASPAPEGRTASGLPQMAGSGKAPSGDNRMRTYTLISLFLRATSWVAHQNQCLSCGSCAIILETKLLVGWRNWRQGYVLDGLLGSQGSRSRPNRTAEGNLGKVPLRIQSP
jgi:hypothetical protein